MSSRASRSTSPAKYVAVRPGIRFRHVTTTALPSTLGGSRWRTCSGSAASSSTMSTRRPTSSVRYGAARSSSRNGMSAAGSPSASRTRASVSAGSRGGRCRSCPRSATKNCPSGKESRVRCAQRRDNVVLPAPAMPLITARLLLCAAVTVSAARPGVSSASSSRSSRSRPTKHPVGSGMRSCSCVRAVAELAVPPSAGRTGCSSRSPAARRASPGRVDSSRSSRARAASYACSAAAGFPLSQWARTRRSASSSS